MEASDSPSPPPKITVDAHIDLPWQFVKKGPFDLSLNNHGKISMVDFPRMQAGGLQSAFFALYISDYMQNDLTDSEVDELIDDQIYWVQSPEVKTCVTIDSAKRALRVLEAGRVPIFFGLEGGRLIHNNLARLAVLREAKVKYLTVTHNFTTDWADSATDKPTHDGLTTFGTEVVKECNKLGIILDISHASDKTAWDVIRVSSAPVIASHSGCRALVNLPRNIPDDLIKEIAKIGGVVHIPFARRFIGKPSDSIAQHVDHVVQLVGIDHVGIGSDLDGADMCDGAESVLSWKHVIQKGLHKRGYSTDAVTQVIGQNTMRLLM